ncbi:hypothetical protein GCM10010917_07990 [Paenibacillus physcomitrellae]|uniref:Uncharacterized protein n=1 Tax=Paenibacillus physcomitrellae TaxID=1619311 RepID=A0ABQ1FRS2_9BACL|nr:hypothetical protein GCM10010917_07990 [Paenibacillus physcomitrellae]
MGLAPKVVAFTVLFPLAVEFVLAVYMDIDAKTTTAAANKVFTFRKVIFLFLFFPGLLCFSIHTLASLQSTLSTNNRII